MIYTLKDLNGPDFCIKYFHSYNYNIDLIFVYFNFLDRLFNTTNSDVLSILNDITQ